MPGNDDLFKVICNKNKSLQAKELKAKVKPVLIML